MPLVMHWGRINIIRAGAGNFVSRFDPQTRSLFEILLRYARPFSRDTELLYALGLEKHGLSQREIAIRIFGEEAILTGWDGVSDHVRTKTRRIIKKGRRLVKSGCAAFFYSR